MLLREIRSETVLNYGLQVCDVRLGDMRKILPCRSARFELADHNKPGSRIPLVSAQYGRRFQIVCLKIDNYVSNQTLKLGFKEST